MYSLNIAMIAVFLVAPVGLTQAGIANGGATFERGLDYYYGKGVKRNTKLGCDLFEQAAKLNLADAQFNLGNCFRKGVGRKKDLHKAIFWYQKASQQNLSAAKNALGVIYLFDFPELGNMNRGIVLLSEAMSAGDSMAPLSLGVAFHEGRGVNKSDKKALEFYGIAASRGNILADALLYEIYRNGLYGLSVNIKKSDYWKRKFAKDRGGRYSPGWTIDCALSFA